MDLGYKEANRRLRIAVHSAWTCAMSALAAPKTVGRFKTKWRNLHIFVIISILAIISGISGWWTSSKVYSKPIRRFSWEAKALSITSWGCAAILKKTVTVTNDWEEIYRFYEELDRDSTICVQGRHNSLGIRSWTSNIELTAQGILTLKAASDKRCLRRLFWYLYRIDIVGFAASQPKSTLTLPLEDNVEAAYILYILLNSPFSV